MTVFDKCRSDAIPTGAVIVTIWQSMGRVVADVACTDAGASDDLVVADMPRPVAIALRRAEELRAHCGLRRVVVVMDDDRLWKPEWGALRVLDMVH